MLDKLEQLSRGSEDTPSMDMIGGTADTGSGDAELFERAVEIAIADGQVSTSTLQRRPKVGYARAGRLTDEMEERGIVSAQGRQQTQKMPHHPGRMGKHPNVSSVSCRRRRSEDAFSTETSGAAGRRTRAD